MQVSSHLMKVSRLYDKLDKYANYATKYKSCVCLIFPFCRRQMKDRPMWQLFTNVVRTDLTTDLWFLADTFLSPPSGTRGFLCRKWQIGGYHSHETGFMLWLGKLEKRHEQRRSTKKLVSAQSSRREKYSGEFFPTSIRNILHESWITMPTRHGTGTLKYLQPFKFIPSRGSLPESRRWKHGTESGFRFEKWKASRQQTSGYE